MLPLLRRVRSTVGVDIGSGYLKIVVVDHGGDTPTLTHVAHAPLVADAIVEGELMDPQLVVETLKSLVAALGLKPKGNVVTAVGGRDVILKKITVDRMRPDEARELIRFEAAQYVPFDMESVQLDFQVLDPEGDGTQMQVLLVAAKRDVVEQRVQLLRDAGLEPAIVDVEALALHNAFAFNYPKALERTVLLLNVGHERTILNVVQEGQPVLTRDFPFGARTLREDLRRLHGLTAEEAEEVIEGRSTRRDEFSPALRQRADELAQQVERASTILGLGERNGAQGVYLAGGASRLPELAAALADRLRLPVEVLNPLQRVRVSPEVAKVFPLEELAPMLLLPLGLGLRTVGGRRR